MFTVGQLRDLLNDVRIGDETPVLLFVGDSDSVEEVADARIATRRIRTGTAMRYTEEPQPVVVLGEVLFTDTDVL